MTSAHLVPLEANWTEHALRLQSIRFLTRRGNSAILPRLYDDEIYECDCDNDEEFVFVSNDNVVTFGIPAEYLED
jgi:hypothetical protein